MYSQRHIDRQDIHAVGGVEGDLSNRLADDGCKVRIIGIEAQRGGLQRDDGAGCGTGVTVGGRKRNLFRNTRKCLNSLTEATAGRIILAEGALRSGFL